MMRCWAWSVGWLLAAAPAVPADSPQPSLVICNVNVVDLSSGTIRAGQDVRVAGDRIVEVVDAAAKAAPAEIDGSGKYLIPGLLDMHAHVPSSVARAKHMLTLFVVNGVTGLREMSSDSWYGQPMANSIDAMQGLDEKIAHGELVGPRIVRMSTGAVHGPRRVRTPSRTPPSPHAFYPPATAEHGRAIARYAKQHGMAMVKTYDSVPREVFFALVEEGKRLGVEVSGHLPKAVSLREASAAGQRTIEHARVLALACSPFADTYRARAEAILSGKSEWSLTARVEPHYERIVASFDERLAREVFAALKANDTYLVPTHITRRMDALAGDATYRDDPRLEYISDRLRAGWMQDADKMADWGERVPFRAYYEHGLRLTGLAQQAGVKIMLGTDAGDTYCFPGFGAHDELLELVTAGLTPLEALRAATTVPAEYLGMADQLGTIKPGAFADLVLIERNPLDDVAHTQAIAAVVLRGKLFDRAALDELLAAVKSQN